MQSLRAVGVRDLKNKLSHYLRLVRNGSVNLYAESSAILAWLLDEPDGIRVRKP